MSHRQILSVALPRVSALLAFVLAFCMARVVFAQAIDIPNRAITIAMTTEPPSLSTLAATDSESFFVLSHVMEGLLQYSSTGELVAGVAERWELREDGATFWLRQDARWSDGKPVTAHDFVYAWRKVLDPRTAAPYASILYPIKNSRSINLGEIPSTSLGVKALDDLVLEVSFEGPCPYFMNLTAFATLFPLREDIVEAFGERYASETDAMVYNGAFVLDEWVHGARLRFRKNPRYWNREAIWLNEIRVPYMTTSQLAWLNLYKDGAIAFSALDEETLKEAVAEGYGVRRFGSGVVFFLEYNFRSGRATTNKPLRKAMQLVFDSSTLVNKVIGVPGYRPLYSQFPSTVKGVESAFLEEYPPPYIQPDLLKARKLIEQARQDFGGTLPPLTLLVTESPVSVKVGEYLQSLFKTALGLDVRLDKQVFKQRLAKMDAGEFDMVLAGWGPDYDDAMTYGDLFASWNDNNRGRFINEEYDHWVSVAQGSSDQKVRMDAFANMQRVIVEESAILPLFEGASNYLLKDGVRNFGRSIFGGDPNYKFVELFAEEESDGGVN